MKHTLKTTNKNFSLLYLNYNECHFNTVDAYTHKIHQDNVYVLIK